MIEFVDLDNVMSIQGYHTMHSMVLLFHGMSNDCLLQMADKLFKST